MWKSWNDISKYSASEQKSGTWFAEIRKSLVNGYYTCRCLKAIPLFSKTMRSDYTSSFQGSPGHPSPRDIYAANVSYKCGARANNTFILQGIIYFCLCSTLDTRPRNWLSVVARDQNRCDGKITLSDCHRCSPTCTPISDFNRSERWAEWLRTRRHVENEHRHTLRSTQNGFCLFVKRNVHFV